MFAYDSDMEIYIGRDGKQRGPFSLGQVKRFLAQGKVKPTDVAWHEGLADWVPVEEITGAGAPLSRVAPTVSEKETRPRRRIDQHLQRPRRNILPVVCVVVGLGSLVAAFFIVSQREGPGTVNQPVSGPGGYGVESPRGGARAPGQFDSPPPNPPTEAAISQVKKSIAGIEGSSGSSNKPSRDFSRAEPLSPSESAPVARREIPQAEDDLPRKPVRIPQPVCGLCRGAGRMTGAQILDGLKGRMRTAIKEKWKFDLLGTPVDQSDETIDYLTRGDTEYQWMQLFLRTRAKCSFAGVTVPNRNTSYACPVCDSESQVRDFIKMLQRVASQY